MRTHLSENDRPACKVQSAHYFKLKLSHSEMDVTCKRCKERMRAERVFAGKAIHNYNSTQNQGAS